MHFLESYLVFHPILLYLVALSLYALNLGLYVYADRKRILVTSISSVPALSVRSRVKRTVIGVLIFLVPGLFLTGEVRALLVGAFLVMQLAGLVATLSSIQATHALLVPGAATGHIAYSQSTQALFLAASLSGFAFFALAAFALTGSPSFLGASLYLGATSVGYRRRARQYALRNLPSE